MLKLTRTYTYTEIKKAIKDAGKGLENYQEIMKLLKKENVSTNENFQKKYKNFYKMNLARLNDDFYKAYFPYMEGHKSNNPIPDFDVALEYFYKPEFNSKLYFSFVSKLLATIDPNLPVWDKNVLSLFGEKNPGYHVKDRKSKAKELYNELQEWYKKFIESEEGKKWISCFDKKYENTNITKIKKIDLILWRLGSKTI